MENLDGARSAEFAPAIILSMPLPVSSVMKSLIFDRVDLGPAVRVVHLCRVLGADDGRDHTAGARDRARANAVTARGNTPSTRRACPR